MMSSGVRWNEDYTDLKSDVAVAGQKVEEPGVDPMVSYLKKLPRAHPPGCPFAPRCPLAARRWASALISPVSASSAAMPSPQAETTLPGGLTLEATGFYQRLRLTDLESIFNFDPQRPNIVEMRDGMIVADKSAA